MIKQNINLLCLTCCIVITLSCASKKGEFAFKYVLDDSYRKIHGNKEFSADREVQWAYIYKRVAYRKRIAVILLKKEIVWVESDVKSDYIDNSKKVIFGTIFNLDEGTYKIILTDISLNKIIDEFEFLIYNDTKDDEFE
jgi:hypothetical protein